MPHMLQRAAVVALSLAIGGASLAAPAAGAGGAIKVGVDLVLSGPASVWGTPQLRSIQMVADDVNQHGGIDGKKIELVVLDNKSDPTQSLTNAKQLVEQDHVSAVIGGGTSPTTMPLLKYMESAKVPLISDGAANPIVTPVEERHWVFKTPHNDSVIAEAVARFLARKKLQSVGFISVNNAYGDSGLRQFSATAPRYGLKIVDQEKFEATDSDVTAQLTKIRDAKPQALVVWAIPPGTSIVAKDAAQLSLPQTLVFSQGAGGNAFTELAQKAANGVYIVTTKIPVASQLPANDPQKKLLAGYVKEYDSRYHEDPDAIAAFGGDAMRLLATAMKNGGGDDPSKIRDQLEKIHNLVSLSGIYNVTPEDHQGLSINDLVIAQFRDGKWNLVAGK